MRALSALLLVVGFMSVWSAGCGQPPNVGREAKDVVPSPEPPEPDVNPQMELIPFRSIHSTTGQKELINVQLGLQQAHDKKIEQLMRYERPGMSNIFLVYGSDFAMALKSTGRALTLPQSADTPIGPDDNGTRSRFLWLVAFLGVDTSSPPAWLVQGAERNGQTIRLRIVEPERPRSTEDVHHYYVWVPLGMIEPGNYRLELFNSARNEVSLMRRVRVEAK